MFIFFFLWYYRFDVCNYNWFFYVVLGLLLFFISFFLILLISMAITHTLLIAYRTTLFRKLFNRWETYSIYEKFMFIGVLCLNIFAFLLHAHARRVFMYRPSTYILLFWSILFLLNSILYHSKMHNFFLILWPYLTNFHWVAYFYKFLYNYIYSHYLSFWYVLYAIIPLWLTHWLLYEWVDVWMFYKYPWLFARIKIDPSVKRHRI